MHFRVKMPYNRTNNIFPEKQKRNWVPLMFLDLKVLSETYELRFSILSRNKQGTVYVFFVKKDQQKQ